MENEALQESLRYPIGRYQRPDKFDIGELPEWLAVLRALPSWMDACIENLDAAQLDVPYRPGGWTIMQVVHHVADSHMNAYVRLKLALTEEQPVICPYNEEAWALLPDVTAVPVNVSVTMLHTIHRRMVAVMEQMSPADWERCYFHPQHQRLFPLWEMAALYVWHSRHHTAHITQLRDRMGWW